MSSIDYTKVYLGNLRKDIQSQILKNQIYDLFRNNLNIQINRSDIKIHPKRKSDFKSAIVDCHDEHEAKHALDQFGTWKSSGQKHVHFNWDSICTESDLLTFDYKRTGAAKKNKTKIKPEKRTGADIAGKAGPSTSDNAYAQKKEHENLYPSEKVDTATTTGKGDESESQRKFYLEDEQLGNETRQKEFKEGYIPSDKKARKELLLKYLSAFLNSGEGGTLYFGVNDQGCVKGVKCSQPTEDELRLNIDDAIKSLKPPVFNELYCVKFTPVFTIPNHPKGDYKVIEIIVRPDKDMERLYSSDLGMFLRRDASVQELKAAEVQEWVIQRSQKTNRQLQGQLEECKKELRELEECKKELRERRKKDELKAKSKVCVIL